MRFFAFLVFLLFCVYALFARYYYVCELRGECSEQVAEEDTRFKNLEVSDGDQIIISGFDQFAFDSATVAPRLNENNLAFLDTLAQLLATDDLNQFLKIKATYRESEEGIGQGLYENLGIARAAAIRQLLEDRNIDPERLSLAYEISPYEDLNAPLAFEPFDTSTYAFEPQFYDFYHMSFSDANFSLDPSSMSPGKAFTSYADSLRIFLTDNPDYILNIVGHTDNQGSDSSNYDLGLKMARSVREYLQGFGLEATINAQSKGEKQPVASNDTEQGQSMNRRIDFLLELP